MKADQYFRREDAKKIKMDEFVIDVEFKYGFPLLILDIIGSLTGYDLIKRVKDEFEPKKPILRLNPENKLFEHLKHQIPDEFLEPIFDFFNELCEKPLNYNYRDLVDREKELYSFITLDSLKRNFHKIFKTDEPYSE